jgi:hypothetical protein
MMHPPSRRYRSPRIKTVFDALFVVVVVIELFITSSLPVVDVVLPVVQGYSLLHGVMVTPATVNSNNNNHVQEEEEVPIDIGKWLFHPPSCIDPKITTSSTTTTTTTTSSSSVQHHQRTLLIFGTYAADFNMIEYGQRLRYYYPILQQSPYNITRFGMIVNCQNSQVVQKFQQYIDLPDHTIECFYDPKGMAGKAFGVSRGWLPDNTEIHPYLKLFGMLFGLGAYATLPAVISGYIGNPFVPQPWITDALTVGNTQQRWPMNALEITNSTVRSKFDDLPLVGRSWGRRPLELATLRLQSMMGISIAHWEELQPNQEALDAGVLTQLGGCIIIEHNNKKNQDSRNGDTTGSSGDFKVLYDWKDPGICAVANFEDILRKLS